MLYLKFYFILCSPRNFNNIVDMETKQELQKDVYNWEDSQHKRDEQREQKKK